MIKICLLVIGAMLIIAGCDNSVHAGSVIKLDSVVKVHDGDTFIGNILGCPDVLCKHIPVRISGIDAPEIRGKCSQETAGAIVAKNYLSWRVLNAKVIELRNVSRDKYFRINAEVFADDVNVGQDMILGGIVREYSGGKRSGWCDSS